MSQQGIFKPRALEIPISIRTSPDGPYNDSLGNDGFLQYRYRGTDPQHRDNQGLRRAMRHEIPLIYFIGVSKGRYLTTWPVYVVGDNPEALTFKVAVDDSLGLQPASSKIASAETVAEYDAGSRRRYVTSLTRKRVHQRTFREKVLRAYRQQCALCRLRHRELLDAAHIVPDNEEGPPAVPNGLALCKLHHGAFDALFLTVRPDYVVEVRDDILRESDGPMLIHGLQRFHGQNIQLPRNRDQQPDPELLAQRYESFIHSSSP